MPVTAARKKRLVMVGNGMAGVRTLEELLALAPDAYDITYRDIADTDAMIDAAARYGHAVVIGGGLLGLEAANGLKLRGMDVTVVHLMRWLMERQLDRAAAQLLQKSLEAKGLAFRLEA